MDLDPVTAVLAYMSSIGRDGGKARTPRKIASSRRNLAKARAVRNKQAALRRAIRQLGELEK
jgi:hypothetical protein